MRLFQACRVQPAFTGARLRPPPMPVFRSLSIFLLAGLLAVPAFAADAPQRACLSKAEQRAAVAEHRAIPLALAIRSLHAHGRRAELVRARLCRHGGGLVYVLTLLARNGKVTRVTVDAINGELINGH
jgi:hypothetical protein